MKGLSKYLEVLEIKWVNNYRIEVDDKICPQLSQVCLIQSFIPKWYLWYIILHGFNVQTAPETMRKKPKTWEPETNTHINYFWHYASNH